VSQEETSFQNTDGIDDGALRAELAGLDGVTILSASCHAHGLIQRTVNTSRSTAEVLRRLENGFLLRYCANRIIEEASHLS
jgi:hypothetical protein